MNSEDDRLVKKMIEEQERENESGTWYGDLSNLLSELDLDPAQVKEMAKSTLKKQVKERIKVRMEGLIAENKGATKMRFIDNGPLQMKEYISNGGGTDAIQTLKTRLNMQRVFANFKGDLELPRLCPYCKLVDDTTEHLLQCTYFGETNFTAEDLHDSSNIHVETDK